MVGSSFWRANLCFSSHPGACHLLSILPTSRWATLLCTYNISALPRDQQQCSKMKRTWGPWTVNQNDFPFLFILAKVCFHHSSSNNCSFHNSAKLHCSLWIEVISLSWQSSLLTLPSLPHSLFLCWLWPELLASLHTMAHFTTAWKGSLKKFFGKYKKCKSEKNKVPCTYRLQVDM